MTRTVPGPPAPARTPTSLFTNCTRSSSSDWPSSRTPAPLPSGTRARARVKSRTAVSSPWITRIALAPQVLSDSTTPGARPATVTPFAVKVAQS